MKKGIVLEQHRKYTIILTKDGEFRKINPIRDAEIGMEITFDATPQRNTKVRKLIPSAAVLAAAACMFLLLLPFIPSQNNIYAYVVVDINPSVELEITEDMKVNAVRSINDDAEVILEQLDEPKNKKIDVVMDEIIQTSEEQGLINEDKNMLVGVSYTEEIEEEDIPSPIEQFAENKTEWNIATFQVPSDVREEAVETNASMNEILASKLEEEPEVEENLDDQEKEIIHSFYHTEEEEVEEVLEEDNSTEVSEDEELEHTKEKNEEEQHEEENDDSTPKTTDELPNSEQPQMHEEENDEHETDSESPLTNEKEEDQEPAQQPEDSSNSHVPPLHEEKAPKDTDTKQEKELGVEQEENK